MNHSVSNQDNSAGTVWKVDAPEFVPRCSAVINSTSTAPSLPCSSVPPSSDAV